MNSTGGNPHQQACQFLILQGRHALGAEIAAGGIERVGEGQQCAQQAFAGFQHRPEVAGGRHLNDLPDFRWVNILLGNVKTSLSGADHAFKSAQYAARYLGAVAYRFNRRFDLTALPERLLRVAATLGPRPECALRRAEVPC